MPYITEWFFNIGPANPTPMGNSPLTLKNISDEMAVLGIEVWPWEALALRRMSNAYLNMKEAAKAPDCPPPFGGAELMPEREAVSRKISMMLAGSNVRRVKRSQLK